MYKNTVIALTNQAYSILKDKELVKDILQDVFVTLFTRRNELPADLNIIGYLTNAVKYKVATQLRDQLSRNTHHSSLLQNGPSFTQAFPYENAELKNRIRTSIDTLPGKCR